MKVIAAQPNLVSQVHDAVVSEIALGRLKPGERIIQEQLAQSLGVSRQPVQQALLLLHNQGVLQDAAGRGLMVAPLEPDHVRNMYDVRAMMEGLAFRRAAELSAACSRRLGPALIRRGRSAVESGSVTAMIAADLEFHHLIHELSKNPLIAPAMQAQWLYTQRVMGETLMRDGSPREIWAQHEEMLQAVMDGDGDGAESLARRHIGQAAEVVVERLSLAARGGAAASPVVSALGV